jgi:hypothetical protein
MLFKNVYKVVSLHVDGLDLIPNLVLLRVINLVSCFVDNSIELLLLFLVMSYSGILCLIKHSLVICVNFLDFIDYFMGLSLFMDTFLAAIFHLVDNFLSLFSHLLDHLELSVSRSFRCDEGLFVFEVFGKHFSCMSALKRGLVKSRLTGFTSLTSMLSTNNFNLVVIREASLGCFISISLLILTHRFVAFLRIHGATQIGDSVFIMRRDEQG